MLRNPDTHRLTLEGNDACSATVREVRKLYEVLRKHFNTEEVYYMISTAAHECVMEEALEALSPSKE
jgi:hypothetical protein